MKYNLLIFIPERCLSILVDKEVAEAFIREWKAWKVNVARVDGEMLEVHGICDSADRAERTINVPAELVHATDVYKV